MCRAPKVMISRVEREGQELSSTLIQHPNQAHDKTVAERRSADGLGRDGKNLGDANSLTLNSHFNFHAACRVYFRHLLYQAIAAHFGSATAAQISIILHVLDPQ